MIVASAIQVRPGSRELWTASVDKTESLFRLVHFSVQRDHVHLLVEGDGHASLRRGIQGLAIRVARAVNCVLGRRGKVWADRYHARLLRTPREVRTALVYVLQNWRKHVRGARGFDARSLAAWFMGWRTAVPPVIGGAPVVSARTWLARVGWRRHGLVGVEEVPRQVAHPEAPQGPGARRAISDRAQAPKTGVDGTLAASLTARRLRRVSATER